MRLLAASASFTGSDQSPVTRSCVVILGSTLRAPSVNALMLRSTWGIGLAAMKPSFFVLLACPATTPLRYSPSSRYPQSGPTVFGALPLVRNPPHCGHRSSGHLVA